VLLVQQTPAAVAVLILVTLERMVLLAAQDLPLLNIQAPHGFLVVI
jgi:hypothetical protein